jgi:hypothetical protein
VLLKAELEKLGLSLNRVVACVSDGGANVKRASLDFFKDFDQSAVSFGSHFQ